MDKKGVEISMNVIIVAAIGLLVLVVLSVIFLGKVGGFGRQVSDCAVQGGKCATACGSADAGTQNFQSQNPAIACPNTADSQPQVCCLPVKIQ